MTPWSLYRIIKGLVPTVNPKRNEASGRREADEAKQSYSVNNQQHNTKDRKQMTQTEKPRTTQPKLSQLDRKKMVELRLKNGLTQDQIAKQFNVSKSTIKFHLSRLIDKSALSDFKKNEDDILQWTKQKILVSLTPDKLEKAQARDLSVCYGIFNQHQRLNAGLATQQIAYDARIISSSVQELRDALKVQEVPSGAQGSK